MVAYPCITQYWPRWTNGLTLSNAKMASCVLFLNQICSLVLGTFRAQCLVRGKLLQVPCAAVSQICHTVYLRLPVSKLGWCKDICRPPNAGSGLGEGKFVPAEGGQGGRLERVAKGGIGGGEELFLDGED